MEQACRPPPPGGLENPPDPTGKGQEYLLQSDSSADLFQLGLDLLCLVLAYAFLQRLGRIVYQFLRFFETQARNRTHFLDNLDLLIAERLEDHVKQSLFFLYSFGPGRLVFDGVLEYVRRKF